MAKTDDGSAACPVRTEQVEELLFKLACLAVASAGNLAAEPRTYGPYRMMLIAGSLCEGSTAAGAPSPRLEALASEVERVLSLWPAGEKAFLAAVEELVPKLVSLAHTAREDSAPGPSTAAGKP